MLLTQKKKKNGCMNFFLCFDQKPPLLYNYVFTEVVPFRKYCHLLLQLGKTLTVFKQSSTSVPDANGIQLYKSNNIRSLH